MISRTIDKGQRVRLNCRRIFAEPLTREETFAWSITGMPVFSMDGETVVTADDDIGYQCVAVALVGEEGGVPTIARGTVNIIIRGIVYHSIIMIL